MKQTLRKSEILRGYKSFSAVISKGKSLFAKPIRCYYLYDREAERRTQAGFAVAKQARRASDRNYIKRRLKEAYRHQKGLLGETNWPSGSLKIVFLFVGEGRSAGMKSSIKPISSAIGTLLPRITREISSTSAD